MNLELIKTLCKDRPGGIKQLAHDCEISESNLHRSIRIGDMTLSTLEKIAHELHVDILTFIGDSKHEELHYWKARAEALQARCDEQERMIKLLSVPPKETKDVSV